MQPDVHFPNGSIQEKVIRRRKMSKQVVLSLNVAKDTTNSFLAIPTNSFTHPTLVINNAGHSSDHNEFLIVVKPRTLWPSEFI